MGVTGIDEMGKNEWWVFPSLSKAPHTLFFQHPAELLK